MLLVSLPADSDDRLLGTNIEIIPVVGKTVFAKYRGRRGTRGRSFDAPLMLGGKFGVLFREFIWCYSGKLLALRVWFSIHDQMEL